MTIGIPIGLPTASGASPVTAGTGVRLNFPLRFGVPAVGVSAPLKAEATAQLLAITVAASVDDPADALALARQARDAPESALAQGFSLGKVKEILAEVGAAQADAARKYDPSDEQRAAAAAVGANARLVAAAGTVMEAAAGPADLKDPSKNTRGWSARRWAIDLLDPGILDRAARASLRATALEPFDAEQDVRTLQKKVSDLEASVAVLRTDVDALKSRGSKGPASPNP
ncbi:MAG: hypothetical protein ABJD07_00550 [Gemmatimonadaceae bacterium]